MKELKNNHKSKTSKEQIDLYQKEYTKWVDDCYERTQNEPSFNYKWFFTGFAKKAKEAKLSGNAIIVYHAIIEMTYAKQGRLELPNEAITEHCGVKGGSLTDSLRMLEEKGFIARVVYKNKDKVLVRAIQLLPYL